MRTNLGAEAENEAALTEQLHIPANVGEGHGIAREGDRDGGDQIEPRCLLSR